jgi:hypothetical protein
LQFHAREPVVLVKLRLDRQIDRHAGLKFVEHRVGESKGYALHARAILTNVKLQMIAGFSDAPRRVGEGHVTTAQKWFSIAVAERAQTFEVADEREVHLLQFRFAIQVKLRREDGSVDRR